MKRLIGTVIEARSAGQCGYLPGVSWSSWALLACSRFACLRPMGKAMGKERPSLFLPVRAQ